MKPRDQNLTPVGALAGSDEDKTGLPWPHTWRGVYLLVGGCFVLWVGLLVALTVIYS
jgi:hypothetical protein